MYSRFKSIRAALLVFLTHNMALPLLKFTRNPERLPYDADALAGLPPHTLGRDLANFLKAKNLKLLPHYAKHDIKHIVLDYDTTDDGEVSLQCFMLGNRHLSFPVAATVLYGFVTMPEHWPKFRHAYLRGRAAPCLKNINWISLLHEETATVKSFVRGKA